MLSTHTSQPIKVKSSVSLECSIAYQMNKSLNLQTILLGLWKERHNNLHCVLWNEPSWTKILCLSHVWPLGSCKHKSHSGSRAATVFNLFSIGSCDKSSAKYLCSLYFLLKDLRFVHRGDGQASCTERANQVKPSAPGLILSVTAGCPGRCCRIPAGQHNQFIVFGKWRLKYESQPWTCFLINLSLCVLSVGLNRSNLRQLTKIWCSSRCFSIFILQISSLLSFTIIMQFHSAPLSIIPTRCTLWHPCIYTHSRFSFFINKSFLSISLLTLAGRFSSSCPSYPCCLVNSKINSVSVSLTWHAACLQGPQNSHSCPVI